jgi:hypothetical protein
MTSAARYLGRIVTAMAFALGCSGDSSGPSGIDVDALNGMWALEFVKTANCSSVATQGTFYLTLAFTASSGTVANTVSKWTNDLAVPDRFTLIGNLNPQSGAVELRLWHSVLQAGTLVSGTVTRDLRWSVTGLDPIPGYQPYMSVGGCQYSVSARRQ